MISFNEADFYRIFDGGTASQLEDTMEQVRDNMQARTEEQATVVEFIRLEGGA